MSGMGGGGAGGEEMAGRAPAAAAGKEKEKSSFAVTCSLLSQYLKERKGALRGLGLDVMAPPPPVAAAGGGASSPPTTMNLLSAFDAPPAAAAAAEEPDAGKTASEPRASGSVELSLEKASIDTPSNENKGETVGEEAKQLTIFYGGKVVVFDNFPSTKVRDLLQMVNAGDGLDMAGGSAAPQSVPQPAAPQNNLSDLPIARRNSLHRFLEKRKGRIISKAPYQIQNSANASRIDAGDKSWLGLCQEVKIKQEI